MSAAQADYAQATKEEETEKEETKETTAVMKMKTKEEPKEENKEGTTEVTGATETVKDPVKETTEEPKPKEPEPKEEESKKEEKVEVEETKDEETVASETKSVAEEKAGTPEKVGCDEKAKAESGTAEDDETQKSRSSEGPEEVEKPQLTLGQCAWEACRETDRGIRSGGEEGWMGLECAEKCRLLLHRPCFRALEEECGGKKSLATNVPPCLTPDCGARLASYSDFSPSGDLRKLIRCSPPKEAPKVDRPAHAKALQEKPVPKDKPKEKAKEKKGDPVDVLRKLRMGGNHSLGEAPKSPRIAIPVQPKVKARSQSETAEPPALSLFDMRPPQHKDSPSSSEAPSSSVDVPDAWDEVSAERSSSPKSEGRSELSAKDRKLQKKAEKSRAASETAAALQVGFSTPRGGAISGHNFWVPEPTTGDGWADTVDPTGKDAWEQRHRDGDPDSGDDYGALELVKDGKDGSFKAVNLKPADVARIVDNLGRAREERVEALRSHPAIGAFLEKAQAHLADVPGWHQLSDPVLRNLRKNKAPELEELIDLLGGFDKLFRMEEDEYGFVISEDGNRLALSITVPEEEQPEPPVTPVMPASSDPTHPTDPTDPTGPTKSPVPIDEPSEPQAEKLKIGASQKDDQNQNEELEVQEEEEDEDPANDSGTVKGRSEDEQTERVAEPWSHPVLASVAGARETALRDEYEARLRSMRVELKREVEAAREATAQAEALAAEKRSLEAELAKRDRRLRDMASLKEQLAARKESEAVAKSQNSVLRNELQVKDQLLAALRAELASSGPAAPVDALEQAEEQRARAAEAERALVQYRMKIYGRVYRGSIAELDTCLKHVELILQEVEMREASGAPGEDWDQRAAEWTVYQDQLRQNLDHLHAAFSDAMPAFQAQLDGISAGQELRLLQPVHHAKDPPVPRPPNNPNFDDLSRLTIARQLARVTRPLSPAFATRTASPPAAELIAAPASQTQTRYVAPHQRNPALQLDRDQKALLFSCNKGPAAPPGLDRSISSGAQEPEDANEEGERVFRSYSSERLRAMKQFNGTAGQATAAHTGASEAGDGDSAPRLGQSVAQTFNMAQLTAALPAPPFMEPQPTVAVTKAPSESGTSQTSSQAPSQTQPVVPPPTRAPKDRHGRLEYLKQCIREGFGPSMPGFNFTDEQFAEVVALQREKGELGKRAEGGPKRTMEEVAALALPEFHRLFPPPAKALLPRVLLDLPDLPPAQPPSQPPSQLSAPLQPSQPPAPRAVPPPSPPPVLRTNVSAMASAGVRPLSPVEPAAPFLLPTAPPAKAAAKAAAKPRAPSPPKAEDECLICLEQLGSGLPVPLETCTGPCGVQYHRSCLQDWFRSNNSGVAANTCPKCRTLLVDRHEFPCLGAAVGPRRARAAAAQASSGAPATASSYASASASHSRRF